MTDEIHKVLREISNAAARTETKVDALLSGQKDHNDRLDSLETLRNKAFGYIMALSAVFAACWYYLPKAFTSIMGGH